MLSSSKDGASMELQAPVGKRVSADMGAAATMLIALETRSFNASRVRTHGNS